MPLFGGRNDPKKLCSHGYLKETCSQCKQTFNNRVEPTMRMSENEDTGRAVLDNGQQSDTDHANPNQMLDLPLCQVTADQCLGDDESTKTNSVVNGALSTGRSSRPATKKGKTRDRSSSKNKRDSSETGERRKSGTGFDLARSFRELKPLKRSRSFSQTRGQPSTPHELLKNSSKAEHTLMASNKYSFTITDAVCNDSTLSRLSYIEVLDQHTFATDYIKWD